MKVVQSRWKSDEWHLGAKLEGVDGEHTLALVFGDLGDNPHAIQGLRQLLPTAHIIGATTAGEIEGVDALENELVVTVIEFEKTQIKTISVAVEPSSDFRQIGRELISQLEDSRLKAVFILSEGIVINGSELVRGCHEVLKSDVLLTGGLAGDDIRFSTTKTAHNEVIASQQVVALGLYSDVLEVGVGSCGGWSAFGPVRRISDSENNELISLDGEPALSVYKNYLGALSEGLPFSGLRYPMQLFSPEKASSVVRTLVGLDEEKGSIYYAGEMPKGASVQLMKATVDSLVEGAESAAKQAMQHHSDDVDVALLISCVGRKHVLKQLVEDELEAVQDVLGEETMLTGFYSYGEIAPHAKGEHAQLHNQTMTITTLKES
ncbi:FIST signal transduction protein [Thaumasiovibrio subtropicus]|uniref:FIST signal transduction protein n=1 Tax=Thaumasiovibrio subtropicus TaxID=1891207 RepID=UPI00131EA5A6|nr:FIST N-terminal domain-containing protein [Thaumasiovibrio subtropicus]